MKPVDVKSNTWIESSKEISNKDLKFKVGDNVTISTYRNTFPKSYTPNCSEQVFAQLKKLKALFRGHMLLVILKANKLLERFMKTNWKKQTKKTLVLKK